MESLCAVTMVENAIRKLHRQLDQAEIIVCGEFIIHVKHDYALSPSAETFVSYLRRLEWELAQSAPQSSLKKLDAELNATSLCLRTVSRPRFTARCFRYTPYYFALPLPSYSTIFPPLSPLLTIPISYYFKVSWARREFKHRKGKETLYTRRFVKAWPWIV